MLAVCELAEAFDPAGPAKFPTYCVGYLKKRLRGLRVAVVKERAFAARGVDLDAVARDGRGAGWREADGDDDGDDSPDGPTAAEVALLDALAPVAREVALLTGIERLTQHQIGQRLGMAVKDVKLVQLQTAELLGREQARGQQGLFTEETTMPTAHTLTVQTAAFVSGDDFFDGLQPAARAAFRDAAGCQPTGLVFGLVTPQMAAAHADVAAVTLEVAGHSQAAFQLRAVARRFLEVPGNLFIDLDIPHPTAGY